ncbi:hypothetical protein ACJJTC_009446 [Scirpophaga incertulas]
MVKCSAYRCASATYNRTPGLTFHRFPKDECIRKVWLDNMKRQDWQPNTHSVLCSKHFEDHLFDAGSSRIRLRSRVIPTLFDELPLTTDNKENVSHQASKLQTPKGKYAKTGVSVLKQVQNKVVHIASTSTVTESSIILEENMAGSSHLVAPGPSQSLVPSSKEKAPN